MTGIGRAASALLSVTLIACGSGPSDAELDAAADAFGSTGELERRGGHWTGVAEPPPVIDGNARLFPGLPVTAIERAEGFPVQRDLRLPRRMWVNRPRIDLDLIAEVRAGSAFWSLLSGSTGASVVRRAPEGEPGPGTPVGTLSAPSPLLRETRSPLEAGAPRELVATETMAGVLGESGSLSIVVAGPDGALASRSYTVTAERLCAIGEVFGTVGIAASGDRTGSACESLYLLPEAGSGTLAPAVGGPESGVIGVGFADGFAFVVSHGTACVVQPCPLVAALHGPDGRVARDLGTLDLPDRGRAIVGAVAGVPIVFGGDGLGDGVLYDVEAERWEPMKPFPLAQEGIVEPTELLLTDTHLVVATRNAVGLWAPAGEGSSWSAVDLFDNPLYVATDDTCLNLRAQPGLDSPVLRCVDRGVQFFADGAHALIDDIRWVSVLLGGRNLRGWVAEQFLSGISPDDPSDYACGP